MKCPNCGSDIGPEPLLSLPVIRTRSSSTRLFRFTFFSALVIGLFIGVGTGTVSHDMVYYVLKEGLMGLIGGVTAPLFFFAIRTVVPPRWLSQETRFSPLICQMMYVVAGFLAGCLMIAAYQLIPARQHLGAWLIVYPLGSAALFPLVAVIADLFETTEREHQRTKEIFSKYVSQLIVERILAERGKLTLTGERCEVTVLYSDIRGFSKMSQQMEAEEIVNTLNEYFTHMVDVVFEHQGTVDKFIGDGLLVVYGAPLRIGDEAHRAVQTAMAMQHALEDMNRQRWAEGKPEIKVGIGLDTGWVVAGNIGSDRRLEYTIIGVPTNNAAYLAKLAEGGQILLTSQTYEAVKGRVTALPWQRVTLKGAVEESQVYAVKTEV